MFPSISRKPQPGRIVAGIGFIRDSSLFSISLVIAGLCGLIRSLFVAKLLGPHAFGTWRFLNIFADYLNLASFGTQAAMNRTVPFLRGKCDFQEIQFVLNTTHAVNWYGSIIYTVSILVWAFMTPEPATATALVAFAPVILILAWLNYTKAFSISSGLYRLRSKIELYHAISTMTFSLVLVYAWGIYGAILGYGISTVIALLIACREVWPYVALKINWRVLWNLIMVGLPIMANGLLLVSMSNVDRILIAGIMNHEMLGIYSVGNACTSILGMIPAAFGQMLFVKFAEMDGQNKSSEHMSDVLKKSTLVLSAILAPITVVIMAIFPAMILVVLPQYTPGIAAGRLLIAGVFFLGVSLPVTNWCVSTGRFLPVLVVRLIVVGTEFLLIYKVIHAGADLEVIALCVLWAFAIFSSLMIIVSSHLVQRDVTIGLSLVAKSVLPFLSVLAVIYMQDYFPVGLNSSEWQLFVSASLSLVVGMTVSVPFLYWANRETHVAESVLQMMVLRRRPT